ncbi:hypothetical protein H0H93_012088 [Arthromyces matolae]|nr:hypothetical protein H0H93_012088 [Arthromyces matolae]
MDQIERGSRDKKNLLVSSDLVATNQMLEGLLARLDDSIILEGRWYENSMRVIASGIDLISQLEKQPSNDLDSNIRILITNFLIYLESAIETVALQISPFAKTRMLPYFESKLQIFINFTESRPSARLTFKEMDAKLEEVYKDRFRTPSELRLHINRVRGVLVKVKKTTSMTWEFRTLEVAHLIAQWSRWPSVALAEPNTNSVLGFYIVYIAAVLKKLNKRHMEKSDVGPVGGTCRREDGEQLKGFLERLKEELEMQQRKFLTAVGSGSESSRRKRPLEPDLELEPSDLPRMEVLGRLLCRFDDSDAILFFAYLHLFLSWMTTYFTCHPRHIKERAGTLAEEILKNQHNHAIEDVAQAVYDSAMSKPDFCRSAALIARATIEELFWRDDQLSMALQSDVADIVASKFILAWTQEFNYEYGTDSASVLSNEGEMFTRSNPRPEETVVEALYLEEQDIAVSFSVGSDSEQSSHIVFPDPEETPTQCKAPLPYVFGGSPRDENLFSLSILLGDLYAMGFLHPQVMQLCILYLVDNLSHALDVVCLHAILDRAATHMAPTLSPTFLRTCRYKIVFFASSRHLKQTDVRSD